jgi:hypothetical protein
MVRVIQTERHVAGEGPVLDPLLTVPSISLWMDSRAGVVPLSKASFHLKVTVHGNVTSGSKGSVRLELPQGWRSVPSVGTFSIAKAGDQQDLDFEIHCTGIQARSYSIRAVADYMGEHYSEGYQIVGYDGLRPYPYYRAANYRVEGADLNLAPNLKIGYVMGTGDDVPQSLADLGLTPDFLSPRDLATQDLSKFDAIVVGIRAYAAHPELATVNSRLLDYVRNGGALIVQYQTPEFDHDYGPYPFSLGDSPEKVVEEKAPVRILLPNDPVFTWPNKITPADFSGWIEERGHDFLSTWDSKYVALTEVHDQGQAPQEGGLIYARYGRGVYVYSAFAFYRQLPEGVPGAYRIFANLLSLSKNPGLTPGH